MTLDQLPDGGGSRQGDVAAQDQDPLAVLDGAARRQHSRAGPLPLGLFRRLHAGGQGRGHVAAARDANDPVGSGNLRGLDDPVQHRDPADGVQDLRERGVHTRPVARGHDERGELRGHWTEEGTGARCSCGSPGPRLSCWTFRWGVV